VIFTSHIFLISQSGPALADSGGGFGHMMWGGGFGMFGGLTMLVFWILIIGLVVLAIRGFSDRSGMGGGTETTAEDILQDRFARGEIDEEEYERRKATLGN
jgi:putative membrane protein